jgi:hypothetical protein
MREDVTMNAEKLNDSGFIPELKEMVIKGKKVYFKNAHLMMGIFQGVGISQSLLEKYTQYEEIVINFEGKSDNDKKYNGWYIAKMKQFRNSDKKFANGYNDVQRFVSFKDMQKI